MNRATCDSRTEIVINMLCLNLELTFQRNVLVNKIIWLYNSVNSMNYFEQLERTLGPEYTEGELVC